MKIRYNSYQPLLCIKFLIAFLINFLAYASSSQSNQLDLEMNCEGQTVLNIISHLNVSTPYKIYVHDTPSLDHIRLTAPCQSRNIEGLLHEITSNTKMGVLAYDQYIFIIADTNQINSAKFFTFFRKKQEINAVNYNQGLTIGHPDSMNRTGIAILKGLIIDGNTDSSIIDARIKIKGDNNITISDIDGSFQKILEIGTYTLEVEAGGYHGYQSKIKVYGDGFALIKLHTNSIELPEIVIGASARSRLLSVNAGMAELSIKEIKKLPALLGEVDVLKALLTLPGVSNTGDVGNGFNVRGGNIDQNLIQQDGVAYLNPTHVIGLFSAFNPDAIKQVTFYKGHIPAQFGGRLSSVLDIKLKDPDFTKWNVFGGVGPVSSKIFIEGPIVKDRTSFFTSSRLNHSDWLLKWLEDPNLKNSRAHFNELNFKVAHRFSLNTSVQLSAYRSQDRFRYSDQFGYGWINSSAALNVQHLFSEKVILQSNLIYSDNINQFFDGTTRIDNNITNGMPYIKSKTNLSIQTERNHQFNIGVEATRYRTKPEVLQIGKDQDVISSSVQQSRGNEYSIYINDELKLTDRIALSLGVRQSYYTNVGPEEIHLYDPEKSRTVSNKLGNQPSSNKGILQEYYRTEPRIGFTYQIKKNNILKWSYNRTAQYIHLISNTAAATPIDIWQMSNTYIKPQKSDNFSFGYYQNSDNDEWESSIELFYRASKNLVEYKDFARLLKNDHLETALFGVNGKAYGSEFYIKRNNKKVNGYLSYTWSRSLRNSLGKFSDEVINNNKWYAAINDKPHNLSAVVNFQLKKTMQLGFNFVYNSGRPLTAPVAEFYLGDNGVFLDYSQRNQYRIPSYHRLDASYTVTRGAVRSQKNKGSLTFAIYNLYSRRNAFSVFYRRNENESLAAYRLAVLGTMIPSISYNFQF